jgi:signal transduction histidine kinase
MDLPSRTILIIDDSAEDRELYRRCLVGDRDHRYNFLEAELGRQGLDLWQQYHPDVVLLDYQLPDLDGLGVLTQLQHHSSQDIHLPVVVVTGQGNEAIAVETMKAGAQDYLVKGEIIPSGLQQVVNSAIETAALRNQLQQRIERERLVAGITQHILQSLDLNEILQITVDEVRQFLQTDRVFVYRFASDFSGVIVVESVWDNWLPLLDTQVEDQYFMETRGEDYLQGRIQIVADIHTAGLTDCHVELLTRFQIQANLAVPILHGNALWGLLVANHCSAPREWQPQEIDLLLQLTKQVGIALQKAELYHQAQTARIEAERVNRVKDEFLAILSHELRSPLTPILGWTKLMQTLEFDSKKTATALDMIERNVKIQIQLIDDLLDVAKILRGKLSMCVAPVNLVDVIQSAIDVVQTTAIAKSINLHPTLSTSGLQVMGDEARLQQIIWNLLSNAIKFTPQQGTVKIGLERVEDQARIIVSDSGKGINPEFLPYIFESFRQEDVSTTRRYGGLGLGLAIVRSLVEAHGGTIWADSPGEEQGAIFTVQLPLLPSSSAPAAKQSRPAPQLDLTGLQVLIVDDDPGVQILLNTTLKQFGADLLIVDSATEALATLEHSNPDVLVSDIGMPELDGYQLIQRIRAIPAFSAQKFPAIALTAYARPEDEQRALREGYQVHLAKPVEPMQLVQAIARCTNR